MIVEKLNLTTEKLAPMMPPNDAIVFKQMMNQYVTMIQNGSTTLPAPNSQNTNVNKLVSNILSSFLNEKMDPSMETSTQSVSKSYGMYQQYYWNYPWWWNYWYYAWSPYYWWRWNPYPYVGGSKERDSRYGAPLSVLDSAVDIQSMNLNCDSNRLCDFNVKFVKGPAPYTDEM